MKRLFLIVLIAAVSLPLSAQNIGGGEVHGNFQSDFQYYQVDEGLGITDSVIDGKNIGMNSYLNLTYLNNNFEAGVRLESYFPPLNGFDERYEGVGLAHRYAKFNLKDIEVTAGNFYEQFGNGLILRSYREWNLGYDNAFDGIRIKYNPYKGVYLKALAGVQRLYWDNWTPDDSRGIVRGLDGEVNLNEALPFMAKSQTRVIAGASFVSKFQDDRHPIYRMPENVGAFAGRLLLTRGNFTITGEYAYKMNDPSADNNNIYKPGEALFISTNYSMKGFAINLSAKRIDNMSFRSDRAAGLADLSINYLPAISKQHVYTLPAMYPYATQANGEVGITAGISYKIKRGSKLGGKYGTQVSVNYSRINAIEQTPLDTNTPVGAAGTLGYESDFFAIGDELYFEDLNVEIYRKINKDIKFTLGYDHMRYNIEVIEGHTGEEEVTANIGYIDFTYKLSARQALRLELQYLSTKEDEGDWMLGLLEYTNKNWFVSVMDQYNNGNEDTDHRLHYYTAAAGFTKNATRIALTYGRQREGIVCVGGVCRQVPAASGISLNVSTSF
jgi:hypothetical protein